MAAAVLPEVRVAAAATVGRRPRAERYMRLRAEPRETVCSVMRRSGPAL